MELKKRVFGLLCIIGVCFFTTLPLKGLDLKGHFVQGGVVFGEVAPGTTVVFAGRKIRVSEKGAFVIGFDRDAPLKQLLQLRPQKGGIEEHLISITKRVYKVQRINGLPPKKVTPDPSFLKRIKIERDMVKRARERNESHTGFIDGFIWPVKGKITGIYGSQRILNGNPRSPHYGIDIAAPTGTPVIAPAEGIVTFVHPDMYFSGGTMIVDHGHGLSSSFLHLSKILVAIGKRVKKGDVIARVGTTGRVTGAHLDWRMNWFNSRVDPELLVPPMELNTRQSRVK